ncbi:hypothetical protein RVR_2454 [Actinacidiphila reveromycinica]|uniref:WXG100 family type VII secretion target n=1 Tax=Actinacidiphila reveromycinica TaxID=659352 RepID=A0A7U3VMT7_9ACTN|nr:hypothetical protein [Streptomyces sp. SN-593]BBA96928.1 hypothetical protein RVR_2454 [Streptomyces sp. SN-593]
MADSDDNKYDGDGFVTGDGGAVYGDPGSDAGSVSDYDTWDWKQIKAAVNGMSAGQDDDANEAHATAVSSSTSLYNAADAFAYAQNIFAEVADALKQQVTALAGDDGPWRGAAADSFLGMMTTFSNQVAANSDVLSGGVTGTDSVPQQLANNGASLARAQDLLNQIDAWYAQQAKNDGAPVDSNTGLVMVHTKPKIVDAMNEDMRKVLKSLASQYQVTIDNIKSPTPITGPDSTPPDTTPPPDTDAPPNPLDTPDGLATPALDTVPPVDSVDPNPDGFPGDLDSSDYADTGAGDSGATAAPFPTSLDSPTGSLDGDPSAFPDTDTGGAGDDLPVTPFDSKALDDALNPDAGAGDPDAFPGGTDASGDPAGGIGVPGSDVGDLTPFSKSTDPGTDGSGIPGLTPAGFPGSTDTGAGSDGLPSEALAKESPFDEDGLPEDFPGDAGAGATGDLADGVPGLGGADTGAGGGAPASFPGDLGLESKAPGSSGVPTESDGIPESFPGTENLAAGNSTTPSSMPYMPGMGGMGAGTNNPTNTDPTDSSGLLDPTTNPWEGPTDTDEPTAATLPGETGLDLPTTPETTPTTFPGTENLAAENSTTPSSMPYMPGMGGMGAGTNNPTNTDPTDSSGLLDPTTNPWEGPTDTDEPTAATLPGETGLDLPTTPETTPTTFPGTENLAAENSTTPSSMPYMPGMGGMGAGTNNPTNTDPTDSSGLLDPTTNPWEGPTDTDEPTAATLPGETGLDLPTTPETTPTTFPGTENLAAENSTTPSSMPYMPGMGGMGAGTNNPTNTDPTDSSGLLDPTTNPWEDDREVAHEVGQGSGPVTAGGAHLTMLHAPSTEGSGNDWSPMPVLPGTAGVAAGGRQDVESTSSAYLLGEHGAWGDAQDSDPLPAEGEVPTAGTAEGPAGSAEGSHGGRVQEATLAAEAALLAGGALIARGDDQGHAQQHGGGTPDDVGPTGESAGDDYAAWDDESSLIPLLLANGLPDEDERDGPLSRYSHEGEETWTGGSDIPEVSEPPRLATWQPTRTPAASSPPTGGLSLSSDVVMCSTASFEEVEASEEAQGEHQDGEADEAAEGGTSRASADLLVQDSGTWASPNDPDDILS